MKLLFDFKTTQHFVGGAAEYVRKVFYTVLESPLVKVGDVKIVGLVDSSIGKYAYQDLSPLSLMKYGIEIADISHSTFTEIISNYHIDKVFIGCAQYYNSYDVESIKCPIVCVIHDLDTEEYVGNHLDEYVLLGSLRKLLRYKFHVYRKGKKDLIGNPKIIRMLNNNKDARLITVSNYSKYCISYHYGIPTDRIEVLYSPERVIECTKDIENPILRDLINSKKKIYLMLSANRAMKNPHKVVNAFEKYAEVHEESYFLTLGYSQKQFKNHIVLPYLSESDLFYAMSNCYSLIFPTFFEGFGYPPMEAMKYGKPVICSNVTSVPEICGDAAIYFSPFFESDIFKSLMSLNSTNYEYYSDKSFKRYKEVNARQKEDLNKLIKLILT